MIPEHIKDEFHEKLCSAAETDSIAPGHILILSDNELIYLGSIDDMLEKKTEWPDGCLFYLNGVDYDALTSCEEVKVQ